MTSSLLRKSANAFFWDFGGTLFKHAVTIIISILLARLLGPEEFGMMSMAMVFISISQVFLDFGFSAGLIQARDVQSITFSSIFYLNVGAGVVLTTLIVAVAPFVGLFFENSTITELVGWLSISFFLNSLCLVQVAILKRNLSFKVLTVRSIVASSIGGIVGVICAVFGLGVYSLVIQQLSSALLGAVLLWTSVDWRPEFRFSWKAAKKLTGFSAYIFFDQFLSNVFQRLDVILIGKVFGAVTLGYYARALSLKELVAKYSSSSLIKVFYPALSSLQDDQDGFKRVYFRVISIIAFLSFAITGLLYVLATDIITLLFGSKWEQSIPIFEVLVLSICNYPLNSMMKSAFISKGKSKENFYVGLIRKVIRLVPLVVAFFYGLYGFTVAVVVVSYILTFLNIYFLRIFVGLSSGIHLKKIFEGVLPLICVVIVSHFLADEWFWRAILAIGYLLFYVGFNKAIGAEGYSVLARNRFRLRRLVG